MVSPQDPNPTTTVSQTTTTGRGFVTPEEGRAVVYQQPQMEAFRSTISWGAVIAGSIFAMAFLMLSGSLAYACGVPAFAGDAYGWGAGVWSIITAAIVYYCAGCVAAYLSGPGNAMSSTPVDVDRGGRPDFLLAYGPMLHGVMAWCLSLPLIVLIFGGWAGATGHMGIVSSDMIRMTINGAPLGAQPTHASLTGAAWGAWISLVVGLVFAAIGGAAVWPRGTNR